VNLVSRVSKKHAIYLPKKIVKELGISEGDKVLIDIEEGKIIIKPVKKFLKKVDYWSKITIGEIESEGEKITKEAEEI